LTPIPIPPALIRSLKGLPGFDEQPFLDVHDGEPSPTSIRFNSLKYNPIELDALQQQICPGTAWQPVPWCASGWYLPSRPSFILDPLWHAGLYYVQEASSMFIEQVYRQHAGSLTAPRVLDACAAPGGKSTHLLSLMGQEGLLVSNEAIRSRVPVLSENLQRWGGTNSVITSNDPRSFHSLPGFFDIVVVDAPCSGSGLFRKDPDARKEWSDDHVRMCGARQQRILADLWDTLKEGGLLIYATCSYSVEENETIVDTLCSNFSVETLKVDCPPSWGITEVLTPASGAYGYRFYPNRIKGEGFFISCMRKIGHSLPDSLHIRPSKQAVKKEWEPLLKWIRNPNDYSFMTLGDTIRALPATLASNIDQLSAALYVRESGISLGQLMHEELIPDAGFALSSLPSEAVPRLTLTKEQALAYLRKDELHAGEAPKGWALVQFERWPLGWVKVLPGRINNYYPKHWRVLKR
jgi:16S rRNA C967 or C1407 C5-methylase (RsmB/RsmF family)/NOL1/NOP2/fmu family ribosome biogenesis protein